MMKHYFWKIFLSTILIAYGFKIIFVPKFQDTKYGMYHDYSEFKWPFGGGLIVAGILVFAFAFRNTKKSSGVWMCKSCIKPFGRHEVPDLICPICNNELEEIEGFYERYPELKDKGRARSR